MPRLQPWLLSRSLPGASQMIHLLAGVELTQTPLLILLAAFPVLSPGATRCRTACLC